MSSVFRLLSLAALIALVGVPVRAGAEEDGYQFDSRTGEFDLYRKKSIGDSDLVAFRGVGVLAGTPVEVATAMLDREHRISWMRDVKELRTVRIFSPGHYVEYSLVQTPFIVKNRDFVVRTDVEADPARKRIVINSRSVVDVETPETSAVRGELTEGRFTLESGPRPGTTKITADMDVDPKGTCPRWMVNHFQKNWPIVMFYSLKGFMARGVAKLPDDLRPILGPPVTSPSPHP
jgi:hypothetical protein